MNETQSLESAHLEDFKKGWFIGDFDPSLFKTQSVEVAIKQFLAGEREDAHFHKIATEFTVVTKGRVRMGGKDYSEGDIVIVRPGVVSDFEALEDSTLTVVKIPGAKDDKYSS